MSWSSNLWSCGLSAVADVDGIPLMPVAWTQDVVRTLRPFRLGRGIRLFLAESGGRRQLTLADSAGGQYQAFPATPAGWIEVWKLAAEWAKPARLRRAVELYEQRMQGLGTPLRSAGLAVWLDEQLPLVLAGLVFLGGHGHDADLQPGAVVDLRLQPSAIALVDVGDGRVRAAVPAAQLVSAEAGGPGQTTAGGFAATTGHGLLGDLANRQAATWMTEQFGRTEMRTTVRITGTACELFLRSLGDPPDQVQIALSAVRALAPGSAGSAGTGEPPLPDTVQPPKLVTPVPVLAPADATDADEDLVAKLERLARLRDSGALTDFEFQSAKARLLG
jgi:hypothetical protein